jgi:hypothetical protein
VISEGHPRDRLTVQCCGRQFTDGTIDAKIGTGIRSTTDTITAAQVKQLA